MCIPNEYNKIQFVSGVTLNKILLLKTSVVCMFDVSQNRYNTEKEINSYTLANMT